MKKMKFTLGLMLSMLILGANVAYSQGHTGSFAVTAEVLGCNFYSSPINIYKVIVSPASEVSIDYSYRGLMMNFPNTGTVGNNITIEGQWVERSSPSGMVWTYGTGGTQDYNFNATTNMISPTTTGAANLFFLRHKGNSQAYNRIEINMAYVNGVEVAPVIKRTIVIAKLWTVSAAGVYSKGDPTGVEVSEYLFPDTVLFRPYIDRMTGIATYIYEDQILPLMDKYTIYSMDYEITTSDKFDSPGINYYQPPTKTDVTQLRSFSIITEAGIKAFDINDNQFWYDLLYRIETSKDLTFKVVSSTPIEVTVAPKNPDFLRQPSADGRGGVDWFENEDGTYTVIVKKVQHNLDIFINAATPKSTIVVYSEEGEGGQTGNAAISADKVWAAGGTLFVEAANAGTLSIYSVTGQLYNQAAVSGSYSLALPKGLFIVQLNGKAYKVVN